MHLLLVAKTGWRPFEAFDRFESLEVESINWQDGCLCGRLRDRNCSCSLRDSRRGKLVLFFFVYVFLFSRPLDLVFSSSFLSLLLVEVV